MMADRNSNQSDARSSDNQSNNRYSDLSDSRRDQERLKPEETTIDLPDVEDIPGQENFTVLPLGALADTTISSDDEEGVGLLDESADDVITDENDAVSRTEKQLLRSAEQFRPSDEESDLKRAALDQSDFEGDVLNERGFGQERTGRDLDIPGSEADDANESIGEEDEENNSYSLGGQGN